MAKADKQQLFESASIPRAVLTLSIPTVLSSLVMVLYNMADTYFVGMLNDPIQNAAVTLAAPVMLAFNAVNNLFGVGSSSMMSRAIGSKDYDTVYKASSFGFWCSLFFGILLSILLQFSSLRFSGFSARRVTISKRRQLICAGRFASALPHPSSTS